MNLYNKIISYSDSNSREMPPWTAKNLLLTIQARGMASKLSMIKSYTSRSYFVKPFTAKIEKCSHLAAFMVSSQQNMPG